MDKRPESKRTQAAGRSERPGADVTAGALTGADTTTSWTGPFSPTPAVTLKLHPLNSHSTAYTGQSKHTHTRARKHTRIQ